MKKYISLICSFCAFIFVTGIFFMLQSYENEEVVEDIMINTNMNTNDDAENDNSNNTADNPESTNRNQGSGNAIENPSEYDVEVTDDALTFYGEDGSVIVYSFENDHLASVIMLVTAKNENAAEYLKNTFKMQIGEGVIENVDSKENVVSVKYDMDYFAEYKNYTKQEIQNMIFENAEITEEGE